MRTRDTTLGNLKRGPAILCTAILVLALTSACSEKKDHPPATRLPSQVAPVDGRASTTSAFEPSLDTSLAGDVGITALDLPIRGGRVHTLLAGDAEARVSVILLHGARYDSTTWKDLGTLALLAGRGHRVVALDLPGFGASTPMDLEESAILAEILPALTRALKLDRPVLVAPSMAGRFVFPYLVAHEKEVAGLVALAPVGIERYERAIADFRLPTLIVWGDQDRVVPRAQADRLRRLIAGSRLEILSGAGHPSYLERPEAFHAALLTFLEEISARSAATSDISR